MAEVILKEEETLNVTLKDEEVINVSLEEEESIDAGVTDINYVPGYIAEEEKRRANEEERIAYYEDFKEKVENGELDGTDGKDGYTPVKGVDYFDGEPGKDGAIQYTAGTNIEITEDNVINCTVEGGGGGGVSEEIDPTVPSYVKSITEEDIENWNNKIDAIPSEYVTESELDAKGYLTEHQDLSSYATKDELFSGSYNDLTDTPTIPTKTSELVNDSGYLTNYEETDPTVPSHVKNITERDIDNWNDKLDPSILTQWDNNIIEIEKAIGSLDDLTTTDKSSITGAINEVNNKTNKLQMNITPLNEETEKATTSSAVTVNLSDSIQNYDMIYVSLKGDGNHMFSAIILPSFVTTQHFNIQSNASYYVSGHCKFPTDTTFLVTPTRSGGWSGVTLNKVLGINFYKN